MSARLTTVLLLAALFSFSGTTCAPNGLAPSPFSAWPNPVEFLVSGETINVNFEANEGELGGWSVTTGANWILLNPTSGTGNGRVGVQIDRSVLDPGEHSDTFQLITNLGTMNITVTVTVPQGTGLTGEIAFASNRDGNFNIYAMNVNDRSVRRLTSGSGDHTAPFYTPDGGQIVFASNRSGNYDIYSMSADTGEGIGLIAGAGDDRFPSVSPDGAKIAFIRREAVTEERILYVALLDGTNVTRMKNNQTLWFNGSANTYAMTQMHLGDSRPAWSRDGSKIYVSYYVVPEPTPTQWATDIAEFSATDPNANVRGIRRNSGVGGGQDSWNDVSPDGTKLAGAGDPRIYVVGFDAGEVLDPILPTDSDNDCAPKWSPAGRHIVYAPNPTGSNREIWVVDTFMTRGQYLQVQLTDNPAEDQTPVWRPQP